MKAEGARRLQSGDVHVSIPYRFNERILVFYENKREFHVSIPYRFNESQETAPTSECFKSFQFLIGSMKAVLCT